MSLQTLPQKHNLLKDMGKKYLKLSIIFLYIVICICKLGFDEANMNKHVVDSGNKD